MEDKADMVSKALHEAFRLGQVYWQNADSEFESRHKKADEAQVKFQKLVDDTRSAILNDV